MTRQRFTGRLTKTTIRPDGPAGQPLLQALFHSHDTDSIVAVWHDTQPPIDLTVGQKYEIHGHIVQHKGRTFLFRPEVHRVLRHLLLRPLDWSAFARATSLGVTIMAVALVILGMNYAASRDQQQRGGTNRASAYQAGTNNALTPANQQATNTDANAATPTTSAATDSPATATPPVTNAADCVIQTIAFGSKSQISALPAGQQISAGSSGQKKICYPNGRSKAATVTIIKPASDQVISNGSLSVPNPVLPVQADPPVVSDPPLDPPVVPDASSGDGPTATP